MPKSKKKRHQRRRPGQRPTPPERELDDALRAGFDSPAPGALLGFVGLILSVAAGAHDPADNLAELVRGLSDQGRTETSAAVLAIATLTGDIELRRRVRRELADRGQVLPRWLAELDRTEPFDRAIEISTVYRDADQLLVGVTVPGGHPLTAVVLVDNELGAFAAEGYVLQSPLEDAVALLLEDADPDVRVRDIPPADARARIEAALHELDLGPGRGGYESWAESRPVVDWMLSLLPAGGDDDVLRELSEDELDEISERFLASPFGPAWTDHDLRPLVDEVVAAGSANGIGDPLVWSPYNVASLLDPQRRHLDRGTPSLDRAPDLLRDLIRYGHAERGLRPELTTAALAAVDAATGSFLQAVHEPTDAD
ncbi:hypothetical protein [Blastococcus sp. CT_GayMR16]|uniref:hypothetical protein n=1 Tax=Blastococcus sp. CT_GayMR16 TaxID=2559607 RepID=UPI00107430EA|nr:hypothetical protein [Blastococcus sp. CT_GayMR16]TFV87409.1 hypothetical protein E4P38_14010 [Blastococcus sp. CT_GayMR16]